MQHHSWYFSTRRAEESLQSGPVLEDLIEELLDEIEKSSASWMSFVRAGELQGQVVAEVTVEADYAPAIDCSSSVIDRLANLGLGLSFDFRWWPISTRM